VGGGVGGGWGGGGVGGGGWVGGGGGGGGGGAGGGGGGGECWTCFGTTYHWMGAKSLSLLILRPLCRNIETLRKLLNCTVLSSMDHLWMTRSSS